MSTRAVGSGTVSFGLVSIPVKLYSATQSQSAISFNLLHKKCGSRLKQQYFCPTDNEQVSREEMVKGYEFAKDQYVMFTPEELKEIEEKSTQQIEITEFVPAAQVDPVYYDKAYYLGPEKGGEKAYRLLAEAMTQTGRAALAKYAARGKQYLVLLRPMKEPDGQTGKLVMQQLHYADEVRPASEVPVADAEVKAPELKLAVQLIEQHAHETFSPSGYEDEVKKRTQELIQRKVDGKEIAISPNEPPKAQIIDLMEALKASLAKKGAIEAPVAGAEPSQSEEAERKPAKRSPREEKPRAKKSVKE